MLGDLGIHNVHSSFLLATTTKNLLLFSSQMGSFVPAEKAVVGVVDRLFARVGASDNVARHMSTFHMEMSETANILTNATSQSFVILDEIGALLGSLPGP